MFSPAANKYFLYIVLFKMYLANFCKQASILHLIKYEFNVECHNTRSSENMAHSLFLEFVNFDQAIKKRQHLWRFRHERRCTRVKNRFNIYYVSCWIPFELCTNVLGDDLRIISFLAPNKTFVPVLGIENKININDKIIAINGKSTEGMTLIQFSS